MGLKEILLKGALLALFLPINSIEAQDKKPLPDSLRIPVKLEEISVEANKSSELGLPEGVADLLSGEDPNQKTYNTVPEIYSAIPGLSSDIYKILRLGTRQYLKGGVFMAGRPTFSYGLISPLQGLIVEQKNDHPNAREQSPDLILDVVTQIPKGLQLEAELFKLAGGFGYSGKPFGVDLRGAVAVRHLGVPDIFPLPDTYKEEVKPLGSGRSDHVYVELGKKDPRSPRVEFEMLGTSLTADFVNATDYKLKKFKSDDHHRMVILRGEIPIPEGPIVETIFSSQINRNGLELQDLYEDSPVKTNQRINVSTIGANLRHSFNNNGFPLEVIVGTNHLKVDKKNMWGEGRPYDINQVHGELSGLLGSRLRGRTNFRLDDIEDAEGLQYSVFGELEFQISNEINISGRGGRLRDRLLSDALEDLLGEFGRDTEGKIQEHNYVEFATRVRTLNHEFGLTFTHLKQNRPVLGNVEIMGNAVGVSYQYASPNDNLSLTFALAYRDLEMTRMDAIGNIVSRGPPLGTSSLEGKIIFARHSDKHSLGATGAWSNNSTFLLKGDDASLGSTWHLQPWITAGTGLLKVKGALSNILGLIIPGFENKLGMVGEGENMTSINEPVFGQVSIHINF